MTIRIGQVVLAGVWFAMPGCWFRSLPSAPPPPPPPLAADFVDPAGAPNGAALASSEEDLAWAAALDAAPHPKEFRAGHVTPRDLAALKHTIAPGRFDIALPNGAPITTPAVHNGKVLFSGGFHGKEFYAADARTGSLSWGVNLDDDGPSAPACADGICVFNTESCTVFAVDAETGSPRWSWWMGDPMLSSPAIASGRVFTSYPATGGGWSNGMQLQQAPYPSGAMPSEGATQQQQEVPQVANPSRGDGPRGARHADASHVIAALDLKTGAILWQRWIDGDVLSSPVVDGDTVHLTTFSGSVFALDAEDGAVTSVLRGRATSAPTPGAGRMFWTTRSEGDGMPAKEAIVRDDRGNTGELGVFAEKSAPYLEAAVQQQSAYNEAGGALDLDNGFAQAPISAKTGAALLNVGQGTVATLQAFQGSRIANGGRDNYATMGDEVVCTDATTGAERWRVKIDGDLAVGGSLGTAPALAGGRTIIGTLAGTVLVLDPSSGDTLRTIDVGHPVRAQPIVHEGWIYVGTEDGHLVGIDTGDRTLDGWPMWGGDAARTASR